MSTHYEMTFHCHDCGWQDTIGGFNVEETVAAVLGGRQMPQLWRHALGNDSLRAARGPLGAWPPPHTIRRKS